MKICLPFSITCWGCRSSVKDLVSRLNLEWAWMNEGGFGFFEYIEGKVCGEPENMVKFKKILEENL